MNGERDLQSLVEFTGDREVVSVYLDTDLASKSKEAVKLMFRGLARELPVEASHEAEAIQKFLDYEFDWLSRGLAIYASGDDLWRVVPLPIPVSGQVWYTSRPYVRVLSDVMDRFGSYCVALVDKESVRVFSVAWGAIHSETESLGEEIKRHRQEGYYAAGYQRHEDNLALHNLKQAIDIVQDYCEKSGCKRLMLGGSPEVLAQIRELASKPLRERIIGEFAVEMTASPNEVLSRSLDIAFQADLEEEQRMVSAAITAAAKGSGGVTGASDTLYSLHQGRVRVLLAEERFHVPGYVCADCGYLSADRHTECPFCKGAHVDETPDVVNLAIHKAMSTGAKVNIVRENEELMSAGGIAAILRY